MKLFLPLLLIALGLVSGQRAPQNVRRPSFSRVNSRPVVIRLPARRPRIRPLPTFAPTAPRATPRPRPVPQPPRQRLPPAPAPAPPRRIRPPAPPAPPTPSPVVVTAPPVPTLSPSQLNQLLGLAGLNGEKRLPGSGVQNLPDLSSLSGALATAGVKPVRPGFANSGLNLPSSPVGPPPPGTFGSGPGPQAPPPFDPPADVNHPLPATVSNSGQGILGVLSTLTKQLTQSTGLGSIIPGVPGGVAAPQGGSSSAGELPLLPALGQLLGGAGGIPPVAGIPRIPGINLDGLAGGIPQNADGQVDVVNLISSVTSRFSNGSTLSELIPPKQVQGFADNLTEALLPETPDVDLGKFMGRWFEGINSPRDSDQRCVVHHYGGLTKNGKTATFTALKIYREGSEFGQVRYSIGYAFRGGHRKAMLQMHSSETTEPTPFWIYRVGPEGKDPFGNSQYEYAVVSNWVRYPVTVLVRDPDKFKKEHEVGVLRWLEDHGFINGFVRAFNLLQPVSYDNCQYADSTFEVFG